MESTPQSRDAVFLNKLREVVLKNLGNENFSVSELSEDMAISRFQIHRKLKSLRNVSVSQFIREVRLEEAMMLLNQDVGTAAEIAFKVGFSSPSYFNKCFQKKYGYPPGEVKKMRGEATESKNEPEVVSTTLGTSRKPNRARWVRGLVGPVAIVAVISVGYFFFQRVKSPGLEKSIAVLPLNNLSTDPDNRFFADGLVEDLLTRLSTVEGLRVISRTSSEMYREKGTKSVSQIARELGVSYIIEGSVQRDDNKARINIQLIDAKSDSHIWSKLFDRDLSDIFKAQSEIAVEVATELNDILSAEQTAGLKKSRTNNVKAFELYQLGRFYWNKRTGEGYKTSIGYFEQAIAEDPDYGLAYAGLADTYNLMTLQGRIDEKEGRAKTEQLALKALQLDPSLAEAHNVLASIYTYVDMNWQGAEEEYRAALRLNPNYSTAHHYYSEHLSIIGKHEEARKHINKAIQLDPLSYVIRYVSVKLYFNRGDFQKAWEENQRALELFKDHEWSLEYNYQINYLLGNDSAAYADFMYWGKVARAFDLHKADSIYKATGLKGLLLWHTADWEWEYGKAERYGLLGYDDKALAQLEKVFDENQLNVEFTFKYVFRNLHSNPRYKALRERIGLPPT